MTATRNARRTLLGTVVSTKGKNTITVAVERTTKHPRYGKFVRRREKYMADDPNETAGEGDSVEIVATRPLSKRKRWRLTRVVTRSALAGTTAVELEPELAEATGEAKAEAPEPTPTESGEEQ